MNSTRWPSDSMGYDRAQLGVAIRGTPRPQTPAGLISGHYPLQDWATSILSLHTWCLSAQLPRPILSSPPFFGHAFTCPSSRVPGCNVNVHHPAPVQSRGNREIASPLRHNT